MSAGNINQDEGKQETIVDILDGTARDKIKKLKWGELRHLAYLLRKNFIKTTLESLDEEKGIIHKEAEVKNIQEGFTDDIT